MKLFRMCAATVAALMMSVSAADAGLFSRLFKGGDCGAAKSCGCADTCQPSCCKPTIARPCETKVYVYQRQHSNIKPPCCDETCAPETCCAPAARECAAPAACAPAARECAAPAACAPAARECAAPAACAPAACAPAARECAAPAACAPAVCAAPAACGPAAADCGAPAACAPDCGAPAQCGDQPCCDADPCEVAKLIYASQTCCYAKDRCKAIKKLGKCNCICNPEIMTAFVYALNDTDERVRCAAASEITKQIRKNGCCCSPEVVAALTCALGDCDKGVRKQAEKALICCGYEIVDGDCNACCEAACGVECAPAAGAPTHVAPPAPPTDSTTLKSKLNIRSAQTKSKLANLFGLAR